MKMLFNIYNDYGEQTHSQHGDCWPGKVRSFCDLTYLLQLFMLFQAINTVAKMC